MNKFSSYRKALSVLKTGDLTLQAKNLNLSNTDFSSANIDGTEFVNCDMTKSDFDGMTLKNVSFEHCCVDYASFNGTKFVNCDLSGFQTVSGPADFRGANEFPSGIKCLTGGMWDYEVSFWEAVNTGESFPGVKREEFRAYCRSAAINQRNLIKVISNNRFPGLSVLNAKTAIEALARLQECDLMPCHGFMPVEDAATAVVSFLASGHVQTKTVMEVLPEKVALAVLKKLRSMSEV